VTSQYGVLVGQVSADPDGAPVSGNQRLDLSRTLTMIGSMNITGYTWRFHWSLRILE
jgi:hypothetical protein